MLAKRSDFRLIRFFLLIELFCHMDNTTHILTSDRHAERLTICISTALRADLERIAAEEERSLGAVVRRVLRAGLQDRRSR